MFLSHIISYLDHVVSQPPSFVGRIQSVVFNELLLFNTVVLNEFRILIVTKNLLMLFPILINTRILNNQKNVFKKSMAIFTFFLTPCSFYL